MTTYAADEMVRLQHRVNRLLSLIERNRADIGHALEWLDGHAAPDVTQAAIEHRLFVLQALNATELDKAR